MWALFLIQLQGQAIGVKEEHETAIGGFVNPNGFMLDAETFQLFGLGDDIVNLKSQMAKSRSLGIGGPCGRRREREQLYHLLVTQGQVGLVRLALLTVILGQDGKPQHFFIEFKTPLIVRADDGNVVYSVDVYHNLTVGLVNRFQTLEVCLLFFSRKVSVFFAKCPIPTRFWSSVFQHRLLVQGSSYRHPGRHNIQKSVKMVSLHVNRLSWFMSNLCIFATET